MSRQWVAAILVVGILCGVGAGSARVEGVDAASFVRDGVGARAFGLGGAYAAVAEGHSIGFWNAAALSQIDHIVVGGMYTNRFGLDIAFQSVSASMGIADGLGAEVGIVRSSIDDIPFTGDEGSGVFSEAQNLFQGCLGYRALDSLVQTDSRITLSLGGGAKIYTHSLLEGRGFGAGFDLSLLARLSAPWGDVAFGWSSQDVLGTSIHWTGTDHNPTNDVPWMNRLGAAAWLFDRKLLVSAGADIAIGSSSLDRIRVGIEVSPIAEIAVRGGIAYASDGTLQAAIGGSVRWQELMLDYAYVPHTALGASHILSLVMEFGAHRSE